MLSSSTESKFLFEQFFQEGIKEFLKAGQHKRLSLNHQNGRLVKMIEYSTYTNDLNSSKGSIIMNIKEKSPPGQMQIMIMEIMPIYAM